MLGDELANGLHGLIGCRCFGDVRIVPSLPSDRIPETHSPCPRWHAASIVTRPSGQSNRPAFAGQQKTAERIALGAPLTAQQCKFAINQIVKDPDQRDLDTAEAMFLACYASEDYKEGVRAFAEKRKPVFTGK